MEKHYFDEHAAVWDEKPERVETATRIAGAMLEQVELSDAMDVLDFGCGTGLLSLPWAGRVKSLVGLDPSQGMLDIFAAKAARMGAANTRALKVDPEADAALPGHYDLIVSSMAFHHVEETEPLLESLYAALKPGGGLAVADLDLDGGLFHSDATGVFHEGFDRERLREKWEAVGFTDIRTTTATELVKQVERIDEARTFTIFLMVGRKK